MLGPRARIALLGMASVAAAIAGANGRADGLPVLGIDAGPAGVATRSGTARYVTLPAKREVVARVRRNGGQVLASRLLPGSFTIPAVAYDGSSGGLSADGRVLVLIQPRARFPRARTTLAILDAAAADTGASAFARGLQLRRDLTEGSVDLPDPLRVAAGPHSLPRPSLRL